MEVWMSKAPVNPASTYRSLCMLDTVRKLIEKLLKPRLTETIQSIEGLFDMQDGFRPVRSTLGAMVVKSCENRAYRPTGYSPLPKGCVFDNV